MSENLILVVEDEASIAEVVSLYLKRAGYTAQIASDGKQAITFFERRKPDLVILDLMLPEIDGLSLTRWLRDRSNVPIIMLTARRAEADRIAGLELGADDYVVKPFSPQAGDRLLLASDGLTNHVSEEDLRDGTKIYPHPQEWAEHLVETALQRGSRDNVTCVVVAFEAA